MLVTLHGSALGAVLEGECYMYLPLGEDRDHERSPIKLLKCRCSEIVTSAQIATCAINLSAKLVIAVDRQLEARHQTA